jgi:hypothetical protein
MAETTPRQVVARKIACDERAGFLMALAEVEGVNVVGCQVVCWPG